MPPPNAGTLTLSRAGSAGRRGTPAGARRRSAIVAAALAKRPECPHSPDARTRLSWRASEAGW
jgi:hypothetical protein